MNAKALTARRMLAIVGVLLLLAACAGGAWFAERQSAPAPEMTIPDVALKLEVKQEVRQLLSNIRLASN